MKLNVYIKFFNKKKWKKNFFNILIKKIINSKIFIFISFFLILVISIIIWTIIKSLNNNIIIAGGSTSVVQIMTNITEQYKYDNKKDILYNSSGSSAALVGVKNGSYSFGFLSKDINSTPEFNDNNFNARQLWSEYNTVRFVFARDYIILIYHLPNGCQINPKQNSLQFKSFFGGEGTKLINKIYTDSNFTWKKAFGNQLICNNNDKFYTITRESGSGTRFFFDSYIIENKKYETNQINLSNGSVFQTILNTPGSIGYISFSYIKRIIDNKYLGKKSIASVIMKNNGEPELPYKIINNNYEFNPNYFLTRPFTGIINYKINNFINVLSFIAWIIDPMPYSKTKYKLLNGKINPYYDSNFILNKHHAAYWYIKEKIEPLSFDDFFFKKYNNNNFFAKSGKKTNYEKKPWNFKLNYKSIWNIIVEKFPKKYQKYSNYEYNGLEN